MKQLNNHAPFESTPIFIGGEGRSGTTMLSLMLNSHSNIAHGPELHFRGPENLGSYILEMLSEREGASDDQWESYRNDPITYPGFHFINRCHRCGIDSQTLRTLVCKSVELTDSNLELFSDRCDLIERIGTQMRDRKKCDYWGIKLMRDIRILDQFQKFWPRAVFIHLIRDGRDVAASQMRDHSKWGYEDIERAALSWSEIILKVRSFEPDPMIIELRYEDVVLDAQNTMKDLFVQLEIPWEDPVLSHELQEHSLYKNPYNHPSIDSVSKPLNASSIGRWKTELAKTHTQQWESIAGTLREELGYST